MTMLGKRIYFPILCGGGGGGADIFNCLCILNVEVLPLSQGIGTAGLNENISSEVFWRRNPCNIFFFFSHMHSSRSG